MNHSTEYLTLTQQAGYVELEGWSYVSLAGKDRASLLHNFCTANIKQLPMGACTEAFILNEKGKVLWHAWVIARPQQLLICGAGAVGPLIAAHLDRYVIREDVQVTNQTQQLRGWFVAGQQSAARLSAAVAELAPGLTLPCRNQVQELAPSNGHLCLAHLEIAGWGYLWLSSHEEHDSVESGSVHSIMRQAEIEQCRMTGLHTVRVDHKTPWFGIDIEESNLPQEVNRDGTAISFTKGCYLGQETVARLDALGRVNQLLVGVEFETDIPPQPGLVVERDGKKILRVTSTAQVDHSFLGLAYIRRELVETGEEIAYVDGLIRIRASGGDGCR